MPEATIAERPNLQAIREASQDPRYDLQLLFRSDIARLCDWVDAQDARIAELEKACRVAAPHFEHRWINLNNQVVGPGSCGTLCEACVIEKAINEEGGTDER